MWMDYRLHFSFKLHKLSHPIFLLGGQRKFSFPLKGFYFENNHRKIWGHYGMLVEMKGNQNGEECTWGSLLETCFWHCHMKRKDIIFVVLLKTKSCHFEHPSKKVWTLFEINYCMEGGDIFEFYLFPFFSFFKATKYPKVQSIYIHLMKHNLFQI